MDHSFSSAVAVVSFLSKLGRSRADLLADFVKSLRFYEVRFAVRPESSGHARMAGDETSHAVYLVSITDVISLFLNEHVWQEGGTPAIRRLSGVSARFTSLDAIASRSSTA